MPTPDAATAAPVVTAAPSPAAAPVSPAVAAPSSPPPGAFAEVPELAATTVPADAAPPPPIFTAPLDAGVPDLADEFTEAELPREAEGVAQAAAADQAEAAPPPRPPDPNSPVAGLLVMLNVVVVDYIGRHILHRDPPAPSVDDVTEGKLAWAPYAAKIEAALGLDSDSARLWMWEAKYALPRTVFAPRPIEAEAAPADPPAPPHADPEAAP